MNQNTKKQFKKTAYFASIAILGTILGLSLQFVKAAWSEPSSSNVNTTNVGAPINTSGNWQAKLGPLGVNTIYADNWFRSQGSSGWYNQTYGGGWYMQDSTWVRAYGAGNVYAPGEIQATNIRANSNLCIGGDCRNTWPVQTIGSDDADPTRTGDQHCVSIGKKCAYVFSMNYPVDANSTSMHYVRVCAAWYNQALAGVVNGTEKDNVHGCNALLGNRTTYLHSGVLRCNGMFSAVCQ